MKLWHVKTLNAILSDNNSWANSPELPLHDARQLGAAERRLALLGSLAADLLRASFTWDSVTKDSNQLRQIATKHSTKANSQTSR